jgi:uncharacterized damage-inducible protein DinB/uncharacterized protein YciI
MARGLSERTRKGGVAMKRVVLWLGAALAAQAATANFFVVYELTPGVDITHLTQEQMGIFQQHGANLSRLREAGTLLVGGRILYDPAHARAVAILTSQSEAQAKEIAAADPAVRAGLMRTTVEPIDMAMPPITAAPVVPDARASYGQITGYILAAAKKMPEAQYGFRPALEVRTFGQLVGHLADAQYVGCMTARGEEYKSRDIEKKVTGKAELIAAMEEAVKYCQETWDQVTPQSAAGAVTLFGKAHTRLGLLDLATAHAFEHYGNMATYLRMQHLVPPSSE